MSKSKSDVQKIKDSIEQCLLQRLASDYDEKDNHVEYDIRLNTLNDCLDHVFELLGRLEMVPYSPDLLSSILILHKELRTSGPWNNNTEKYLNKFKTYFDTIYGNLSLTANNILGKNELVDNQKVFDLCMEKLHMKLTSEQFKKYPSLLCVYCDLINNIKDYNVVINAPCTFPTCVLLIDDFNAINKLRGLKCCKNILTEMSPVHFQSGNYYEVIFGTLIRCSVEKDVEITKLASECLMALAAVVPVSVRQSKFDIILSNYLQEIHTETNLYRKAICFKCITNVINSLGINSVKRKKMYNTVLSDGLDICCDKAVMEILCDDVLQCLQVWIQHCWCTWQLASDKIVIAKLLKLLYSAKEDRRHKDIISLLHVLMNICTPIERAEIMRILKRLNERTAENVTDNYEKTVSLDEN